MPVSVRLPVELREKIGARAEREVRSVSQEIVWLLQQGIEAVEQREREANRD